MRPRRHAWLVCSLAVAVLFGGRVAQGQTFTLTPSNMSANVIPSPTNAAYTEGTSSATQSWTVVAQCPNGSGNSGSRCPFSVSSSSGTLASVRVTMLAATGSGCTGVAGTYTLQSTQTELFSVARGNGNSCTTTLTFAVNSLSITSYQSTGSVATSTFTRAVQFLICNRTGGASC